MPFLNGCNLLNRNQAILKESICKLLSFVELNLHFKFQVDLILLLFLLLLL